MKRMKKIKKMKCLTRFNHHLLEMCFPRGNIVSYPMEIFFDLFRNRCAFAILPRSENSLKNTMKIVALLWKSSIGRSPLYRLSQYHRQFSRDLAS